MSRARAGSPSAKRARAWLAAVALATCAGRAYAQTTPPRLVREAKVDYPAGGDGRAASVLLELTVDASGRVERAVPKVVAPADAPAIFAARAAEIAGAFVFEPATTGGARVAARVSYLMLFSPPAPDRAAGAGASTPAGSSGPPTPAAPPRSGGGGVVAAPAAADAKGRTGEQGDTVELRGGRATARGVGEFRLDRELLEASPRLQTSELLSAAPGFFVDHEDGEGLGNDVYLRGFDLDHGSGIEFHVGGVPINIPTHILGQGYADLNFVIPEVVRSIHVIEGVYDPRQGDAAIVGSADFELGVAERGYRAKASYGSFGQSRLVGIFAPEGEDERSFGAVALRHTNGFGPGNRNASSASANAQYVFDLAEGYRARLLTAAHGARAGLAGVLREDDLDAGRVGYFDSYDSPYAGGQSTTSSRVIVAANVDHLTRGGGRFEANTWAMVTDLRLRANYTGNLETSRANPAWFGRGDLFESVNDETALGAGARFQTRAFEPFAGVTLRAEPGLSVRSGASQQRRALIAPADLSTWDVRTDAGVRSLDVGGYFDLDARLLDRVHVAGGLRADALDVVVDDHLAGTAPVGTTAGQLPGVRRESFGVAPSPRVTFGVDVTDWLTPSVSYGQGFRSLDAQHLREGATQPYSKVSSAEAGLRAHLADERYVATLAFFQTRVGNELVFESESGGLETQSASVRRGMVASVVARPVAWLIGSYALSVDRATYEAATADGNHFVPGVPPLLFRADMSARGRLLALAGREVQGRLGAGFTLLSARHLSDNVIGRAETILNVGAGARYGALEIGLDAYNVLDLRYPDDEEYYTSNWSTTSRAAQPLATPASHISAAPPRTVLASLTLSL